MNDSELCAKWNAEWIEERKAAGLPTDFASLRRAGGSPKWRAYVEAQNARTQAIVAECVAASAAVRNSK